MTQGSGAPTPWQLWAVGLVSLLWNGFGAYAYVMIHYRDAAYLAQYPGLEQMIDAFPAWVTAAWAFGVWGSVAGSLLLLLRSRFALHAFGLSIAGLVLCLIYHQTIDVPAAFETSRIAWMYLVILAVLLLQFAYARAMGRRGFLR